MRVQEFLRAVTERVREALPPELRDFQVIGPMASLVKLHYGDRRVHYELWVQQKRGIVEVGLHFEGDPARNARSLEALSRHYAEIASALGPGVEPEQWTESWTRIHLTLPLAPLEEPFAAQVAERAAALIQALEPMVRGLP
jgi:hypothetical protein